MRKRIASILGLFGGITVLIGAFFAISDDWVTTAVFDCISIGFWIIAFAVLYFKKRNLTMYSFDTIGGGVLFVIATNREKATEEAEVKFGAGNIRYLTEDPIDEIPFTIYR